MSTPPASWSLAFSRFGLGARPGDGARGGDSRQALIAEITAPDAAVLADPSLRAAHELLAEVYAYNDRVKRMRDAESMGRLTMTAMPEPAVAALIFPPPSPDAMIAGAMKPEPSPVDIAFRAEAAARLNRACAVEIGFAERWVAFWSNHFCVSAAKNEYGEATAGAFEREAIRPHAFGQFGEMLRAVEQHQAMLNFLDNAHSMGPNSLAGHNSKRGLNENLAREILELHTMGVGSGYSQADVTQLAYMLTGWTIVGSDGKLGEPGGFAFNPNAHEPLAAEMLGRLYMQEGVGQGEAALADLAREPATAKHVAFKLARHFVADAPDPALVGRLEQVFVETDGDLAALARALVLDEAAWTPVRAKMRNPWELVVAAYRAFGRDPTDPRPALSALRLLGMPLWQPAGPNGFGDLAADWASPEGMKMRVEIAAEFARRIKRAPPPIDLASDILGREASDATRETIERAESVEQAYALLLLSPEFQRR